MESKTGPAREAGACRSAMFFQWQPRFVIGEPAVVWKRAIQVGGSFTLSRAASRGASPVCPRYDLPGRTHCAVGIVIRVQ